MEKAFKLWVEYLNIKQHVVPENLQSIQGLNAWDPLKQMTPSHFLGGNKGWIQE